MRSLILAFTLLLSGCIKRPPPPDCTRQTGGIVTYGTKACAGLKAAIDRCLVALESVTPIDGRPAWTQAETRDALRGWALQVLPDYVTENGVWHVDGRKVGGMTYDAHRVIQVGTADWPKSSLCHELAHLYETEIDQFWPVVVHDGWDTRGIWTAAQNGAKP